MKIVSLNINDVRNRNRFRQVVTQMRKNEMTVLTLQNVHVNKERAKKLKNDFSRIKILVACKKNETIEMMILIDFARAEFDNDVEEMNC